jgi:hypothetical protein
MRPTNLSLPMVRADDAHVTDGVPDPGFVCPLCGATFDGDRSACSRCDSTLVVSIDDRRVYETVLPMCGHYYDLQHRPGECRDDAAEPTDGDDGRAVSVPLLSSIRPIARWAATLRP